MQIKIKKKIFFSFIDRCNAIEEGRHKKLFLNVINIDCQNKNKK